MGVGVDGYGWCVQEYGEDVEMVVTAMVVVTVVSAAVGGGWS